jgi:hypothetical protein
MAEYKKILEEELPAFNRTLSENNVAAVVAAAATTPAGEDSK